MRVHYKLSWFKCSLNVIVQIYVVLRKLIAFPLKNKALALKCLGTNKVRTKVCSATFSGILSSGGLLRSDWLPPKRVIAHYHNVDFDFNSPRRSHHPKRAALAAGSHWKWMTSGHFDALAACSVNAQLVFSSSQKNECFAFAFVVMLEYYIRPYRPLCTLYIISCSF